MYEGGRSIAGVISLLVLMLTIGCGSSEAPTPTEFPTATPNPAPGATATPEPRPTGGDIPDPSSYLLFNQSWLEGLTTQGLDLEDVDAVFWHIFSQLPDDVMVYPTENYYYYTLYVEGRILSGNIRLPTGRRDRGVLSFAYFEFTEFPVLGSDRFSRAKYFTDGDGLRIDKVDDFTYTVHYNGRAVNFHFYQLPQEPPKLFPLGEDEVFVERTFDESGYQFFLLFNEQRNYFLWVLNEENGVDDILEPLGEDLVVGKRSGFAFWVDTDHGDRKVLVSIRRLSVSRNDYYDGPFDQLADNYADEVDIAGYMQRAIPGLEGRIDKYGYYTDSERPVRVALSNYGTYSTHGELQQFLARAQASEDPYQYISRGGVPLPQPAVTPTPAATSSP